MNKTLKYQAILAAISLINAPHVISSMTEEIIEKKQVKKFIPPMPTTSFNGMFWHQDEEGNTRLKQQILPANMLKAKLKEEGERIKSLEGQFHQKTSQMIGKPELELYEKEHKSPSSLSTGSQFSSEEKQIGVILKKLPEEDQKILQESYTKRLNVAFVEGETRQKIKVLTKLIEQQKLEADIIEFMEISQSEFQKLISMIK